jgi:hypothetical protein
VDLGGPEVANVDLVLGQGRVAGQAILKDVGRSMLARNYDMLAARPAVEAGMFPFSLGQGLGSVVLLLVLMGFAYELGRRRKGH